MLPTLFLLVPVLAAPAPKPGIQPIWISVLPTLPGRVYGLGVAPLGVQGGDAAGLRQATDNARTDVIARMRANIQGDTRITTRTQESRSVGAAATGNRTQDTEVATQVQAQASELPGLVVEETFLDRPGQTGYALAYLDLGLAQGELRTRLDALRADLEVDRGAGGVRGKLVAAQALTKAHVEVMKLDDLAGLLGGGGGDPALRAEVLRTRQDLERRMVAARGALTFGLAPAPGVDLDPDVVAVVRTAVLKQGMGWSNQNPLFSIALRVHSGHNGVLVGRSAWWDRKRTPDFIIAQGSLGLTLVDSTGQEYESMSITAKGVGVTEFQADDLLLADYRAKLGKAVAAWLADLAKW
jgi:hypothetical protein